MSDVSAFHVFDMMWGEASKSKDAAAWDHKGWNGCSEALRPSSYYVWDKQIHFP